MFRTLSFALHQMILVRYKIRHNIKMLILNENSVSGVHANLTRHESQIEAAQLVSSKSDYEEHILVFRLSAATAGLDTANQCVISTVSIGTEALCDGQTRGTLGNDEGVRQSVL